MHRRTFLSTLAAAAASPALPVSLPAGAPGSHIAQHFAKAKLLARCHDRASPEMFARLMRLDTQTAQGLFEMLKDRAVIAPGLDGVTRAINPLNTHCVPNEAKRARELARMTSDLAQRVKHLTKDNHGTAKDAIFEKDREEDESDRLSEEEVDCVDLTKVREQRQDG